MWRLYGGNARGICMVFSFKSQQNSVLKKIQYVAKEDDIIKRLNQLMLSLKDLNINFFLDKYLNSTCIRIRLLQLPNIRKKFTNIFPGVLLPFSFLFFYSFILLFFYSSASTSPPFPMSQLVHNNHPRRRLRTHTRIVYIQKTCQNNHTQKTVTSRLGEVSGTSPFRPRSLSSHASPGV